jgi:hypothetical protein
MYNPFPFVCVSMTGTDRKSCLMQGTPKENRSYSSLLGDTAVVNGMDQNTPQKTTMPTMNTASLSETSAFSSPNPVTPQSDLNTNISSDGGFAKHIDFGSFNASKVHRITQLYLES